MTWQSKSSTEGPVRSLESRMRKLSLVISVAGLGLMCFGLMDILFNGGSFSLPGLAVTPIESLISGHGASLGMTLASAGIFLLGLLPAMRVLVAAWLFLRSHNAGATLVAVVVLLELLVSIHLGR